MKRRNMTYKPVVVDKAARALSIETIEVPGKDGKFVKAISHDNLPVLVPVRSLEEMRNLVNLNIRQRDDSSLTRTPDMKSKKIESKRYLDKLKGVVHKLSQPFVFDEDYFDEGSSVRDSELISKLIDKDLRKYVARERKETVIPETLIEGEGESREDDFQNTSDKNKIKSLLNSATEKVDSAKSGLQHTEEPINLFKGLIRKKAPQSITKKESSTSETLENQQIETPTIKLQTPLKESPEENKCERLKLLLSHLKCDKLPKIPLRCFIFPEKETETRTPTVSPKNSSAEMPKIKTIDEHIPEVITLQEDAKKTIKSKDTLFSKLILHTSATSIGKRVSESKPIRFLIYGHINSDKQPVFIIQPYEGDSLLGGKKLQVDPKISNDGIDVLVSGKFYSKNILEEENNLPKYIQVDNRKIAVDEKSIIFQEGVTEALSTNEIHILVKASFIKHEFASYYTPLLFIGVERNSASKYNPFSKQLPTKKRVLLSKNLTRWKKVVNAIIPEKLIKGEGESKEDDFQNISDKNIIKSIDKLDSPKSGPQSFFHKSEIPTYTIETRGFELFPTRTEGGEVIYESSPIRKPKEIRETLNMDKGIYENHPRKKVEIPERGLEVTECKTVYGDDLDDINVSEKLNFHPVYSNEPTIYECGKYKSKNENALETELRMCQSKTEYGDSDVNHSRSTQEMMKNEWVNVKPKRGKTEMLKRLNKIIFSK